MGFKLTVLQKQLGAAKKRDLMLSQLIHDGDITTQKGTLTRHIAGDSQNDIRVETVVNVLVRNTISLVRLVESSDLVLKIWVDEFLGLRPVDFQNQKMVGGEGSQVDRSQFVGVSRMEGESRSTRFKAKGKKDFAASFPILNPKETGGKSYFLDKGKCRCAHKSKFNHKKRADDIGCIQIGNVQLSNHLVSSEEESSSSDCELDFLGSNFLKGEGSKTNLIGLIGIKDSGPSNQLSSKKDKHQIVREI
ncbi:hypothetical protein EZV62_023643 [Acer yangbiense]|uniref:Uncharacterized protein n=1 Tax=Acer yangbiense TaxID=1000413 RepID=A0A5C7H2X4_9ROSI|nr:hypothetical protein EZV62_023643 [Acer yangbiense]